MFWWTSRLVQWCENRKMICSSTHYLHGPQQLPACDVPPQAADFLFLEIALLFHYQAGVWQGAAQPHLLLFFKLLSLRLNISMSLLPWLDLFEDVIFEPVLN